MPTYSDTDSGRTRKFGIGFVAVLIVMAFVFFIVAGRMERHQYRKGNLENQPTTVPSQPPPRFGP